MKYTSKPYHYFISGLPDIAQSMKEIPFTKRSYFEMVERHIDSEDYEYIKLLRSPVDHHNLLHILLGRPTYFVNDGNFSQVELTVGLEVSDKRLPKHMQMFLTEYRHAESIYETSQSWENRLIDIYIQFMIEHGHPILKHWFEFERNYRNILTAVNCHKYGIKYDNFLIGNNIIKEQLLHEDPPRLEGLRGEFPYLNSLYGLFSIQDLVDREQALISIKWKYLEEVSFFEYFGIGFLIAYTLKYLMAERWYQLTPDSGKQNLNKVLDSLFQTAVNN